jgi:hypothetical protein
MARASGDGRRQRRWATFSLGNLHITWGAGIESPEIAYGAFLLWRWVLIWMNEGTASKVSIYCTSGI